METRSGRPLSSPPPPPPPGACRGRTPRDADLISSLPDDILLLVLVRLRCVLAAARTGVLARRWRDLWTRLPDLAFHRVAPATVESALVRFAASPAVSLLYIRLRYGHTAAQANSLLRAAAAISPAELVCNYTGSRQERYGHIELPCFHRTTSIELETLISVKPPTAGEFAALERLSLNANVVDFGTLLNRCPRLRVLSATFWGTELLTLQSVRELPALERLTLNGNIADLGTFLNRCPRVRLISITFRSVAPGSLEAVLATIQAVAAQGTAVSLLGIRIPSEYSDDTVILRAAARLSPQEFAFIHLLDAQGPQQYTNVDMPCFHRTTSIKIAVHNICFTRLLDGEFSKLERLSLKGCIINDLGTLLSRCPRLRVLKVKTAMSRRDIKVHSASLQELVFGTHTECRGIEIVTPMLKQLKMEVQADKDIRVFVSAPSLLEKVSWRRSYTGSPIVFGVWHLQNLSLERRRVLTDKHLQNPSSDGQGMLANKHLQNLFERVGVLTYNHVLFMDMCASDSSDA